MRQHARTLRRRRPLLDSLEGRELLSALYEPANVPPRHPAAAVISSGAGIPSNTQVSRISSSLNDRTDPDDPQDDREEVKATRTADPESVASSGSPRSPVAENDGSNDLQAVGTIGTGPIASRPDAEQEPADETFVEAAILAFVREHSAAGSAAPPHETSVAAAIPIFSASPPGNVEIRPMVTYSSGIPTPLSSITPTFPSVGVPRGGSGPEAAPEAESESGGVVVVPAAEAQGGDGPEGASPQGAGLIAHIFPFGRFAPDEAIDRFLARIEDLAPRQGTTMERVSATLAVLAAAIALEVARRQYRRRHDSEDGRGPRVAAAWGSPSPPGFPGWPGPWSASPR
jgi:hypothetical protein